MYFSFGENVLSEIVEMFKMRGNFSALAHFPIMKIKNYYSSVCVENLFAYVWDYDKMRLVVVVLGENHL